MYELKWSRFSYRRVHYASELFWKEWKADIAGWYRVTGMVLSWWPASEVDINLRFPSGFALLDTPIMLVLIICMRFSYFCLFSVIIHRGTCCVLVKWKKRSFENYMSHDFYNKYLVLFGDLKYCNLLYQLFAPIIPSNEPLQWASASKAFTF